MYHCEKIMTRNPVTCRPSDTIATAASRMRTAEVGALLVVDGNEDWLVGILTDRDIARRVVSCGIDPLTTPVLAVMTRDVVVCLTDDDLYQAMERMEDQQVQRVPIVDDDGRLVGIVTNADLSTRPESAGFLEEIHAED